MSVFNNLSGRQRTEPLEVSENHPLRPQAGEYNVGEPQRGAFQGQTDRLWRGV